MMKHWTEIYTALCVARSGTVSKAAHELGVHRATVNRHVDALEAEWGTRLFLRHRRGYELTDSGRTFLEVAARAHEMLDDLAGRLRVQNSDLEGEIVVTTLFPLTNLVLPAILDFRRRHPRTRVALETDAALARLERAEAHIALRVGAKPGHADYVVQRYCLLEFAPFAHRIYIDRRGRPDGLIFSDHAFVGNPDSQSPAPFEAWLARNVSPEQVVVRSANPKVIEDALMGGEGIGFLPLTHARNLPDLEQVSPAAPEWQVQSWLVTHVDVHRSDMVQSMLACLKALVP